MYKLRVDPKLDTFFPEIPEEKRESIRRDIIANGLIELLEITHE